MQTSRPDRAGELGGKIFGDLLLVSLAADVTPDLVNLLVAQHVFPRRHLVLAISYRVVETRAITSRQTAQVKRLAGVDQLISMTVLAIIVVDTLASFDLGLCFWRRIVLRQQG